METTHIPLLGRIIPLAIRRHKGARRISLRLSPARNAVVMTLPVRASVASGMDFFHSKADWVLQHMEADGGIALTDGALIPILGEPYTIRCLSGRGVSALTASELQLHCKPEFVARRARDFLRKHLREHCLARACIMAQMLGKTVRDVKIRDTRSRWGSCNAHGTLTFHWQLAFAPAAIVEYLVAHEVAHLKEMNHSVRFWQIVARLCPDHAAARTWLRQEGHRLHRYGA